MKRYRWNRKKFARNMVVMVSTMVVAYIAVSYIDICIHNFNGGSEWELNLFNLLLK